MILEILKLFALSGVLNQKKTSATGVAAGIGSMTIPTDTPEGMIAQAILLAVSAGLMLWKGK